MATNPNIPGYLHNARHRLTRVDFALMLPRPDQPGDVSLMATGRSDTKRAALWSYAEHFDTRTDKLKGYGPCDALHHIGLVAIQDTPTRLDQLNLALKGGVSWAEEEVL